MNSDETPVDPAPSSPTPNEAEPDDITAAAHNATPSLFPSRRRNGSNSRSTRPSRRRRHRNAAKADPGLVKKSHFLTHLLKNLDLLVYAEIATLYYMECSALRFFLRAWTQQNFISPKPEDWPIPLPAIQAQILSVFFPAAICILVHLFASLPTAGETSRGYLHGGMIVDFIGQKPPSSRLTLLALDLAILVLQCVMLSVHVERERVRLMTRPKRSRLLSLFGGRDDDNLVMSSRNDIYQGAIPEETFPSTSGTNDDIEMQPLTAPGVQDGDDEIRASAVRPVRRPLQEVMDSGNGMLRDFYVLHTIRGATPDFWGAVGHSLRSVGYQTVLTSLRARRNGTRLGRTPQAQGQGQGQV